ncbi:hypothetical protein CISIN_1g029677mg [Citrus sinensis]|uniref:Uncharacterized protein n=1 Tax=Citrus sinensis TaxID=2711 RepID=A0A067EBX3_CITSI|nr:hypothetical protein CISIN_1g029677mg [Citrus sinensis]
MHSSWWQSVGVVVALLVSWTNSTVIYLSGTALFHLVCNLQVIHFENYGKLLERDLYVSVYVEEHTLLKYNLSKISHRFWIFLLLEFLVVTATPFVALLETTGNSGTVNFVNGGDFAISAQTPRNYSESDLVSVVFMPIPTNAHLASYMSMYHKRQDFWASINPLVILRGFTQISIEFSLFKRNIIGAQN